MERFEAPQMACQQYKAFATYYFKRSEQLTARWRHQGTPLLLDVANSLVIAPSVVFLDTSHSSFQGLFQLASYLSPFLVTSPHLLQPVVCSLRVAQYWAHYAISLIPRCIIFSTLQWYGLGPRIFLITFLQKTSISLLMCRQFTSSSMPYISLRFVQNKNH